MKYHSEWYTRNDIWTSDDRSMTPILTTMNSSTTLFFPSSVNMFVRLLCPSQVPLPEGRPRFRQRYIEEKRTNNKHVYTRVPRAVWYVWCLVQCMVCGVCGVMYAMRVAETRIERTLTLMLLFFFLFVFLPFHPLFLPPSASFFLLLAFYRSVRRSWRSSLDVGGRTRRTSCTPTTVATSTTAKRPWSCTRRWELYYELYLRVIPSCTGRWELY